MTGDNGASLHQLLQENKLWLNNGLALSHNECVVQVIIVNAEAPFVPGTVDSRPREIHPISHAVNIFKAPTHARATWVAYLLEQISET